MLLLSIFSDIAIFLLFVLFSLHEVYSMASSGYAEISKRSSMVPRRWHLAGGARDRRDRIRDRKRQSKIRWNNRIKFQLE